MTPTSTILVFGATGGTGQHFTRMALREGHIVRAFVRKPLKLQHLQQESNLHLYTGSITDVPNLDELVKGVDYIVAMLGDVQAQRTEKINLSFVEKLIPSMRKNNVKTFFYQAGGLSKPYNEPLSPLLWILRNTMISFLGYGGQHQDNEAVMKYLELNAKDIDWIVHRAGISSNGPTKGTLIRSKDTFSVATFQDCAAYNSKTMMDQSAVHTCHLRSWSEQAKKRLDQKVIPPDGQSYRIILTKRAPLPSPDMLFEAFENRRPIAYKQITRRMEATFEIMPNSVAKESSHMSKILPSTTKAAEHLHESGPHPLINHPVIAKLDQKRELDHVKLEQSDQKVKKAQAQRDAILQYKPNQKYEKGRRASELTLSNLSLGKAAIIRQVKKLQAIHPEKKLQKMVNKAREQGVVS